MKTPWPALAFAVVCAGMLATYVGFFRGEISSLVCAGQEAAGQPPLEAVRVGFPGNGFDGQFYYAIARNPWARHDNFLDLPAYRHTRILVPAVAWAVTGGDPIALLWALPLLNGLALVGLARLGASLATHYRFSPWWGFLFPFALNAFGGAFRDLTDPVSTCAACGLVTAYVLGWRSWTYLVWGSVAVLSREQNVALVGLVGVACLVRKQYRVVAVLTIPILLLTAWVFVLRSWYGSWPVAPGNTGMPFDGYRYRLNHMTGTAHSPDSPVHLLAMGTLTLHLLLTLRLAFVESQWLARGLAGAGAALALIAGESIYLNLESYTRVFWWMPFGVWLAAMQTGRRWPLLLLCTSLIWPVYSLAQAWSYNHRGAITFH